MKVVILWELARRQLFTWWWAVGISILIGVTVLSYLAIDHDINELSQALQGLTDSAGTFFGGTDFFSPVGFLSSQIYYMLLPILLIIMVATLVSGLVGRDENDTTVELTLARPMSRLQLLLAKAFTATMIIMGVCVVTFVVAVVAVAIADLSIDYNHLLLAHVFAFLFSMSFGVISFALMAFSQTTRKFATIIAMAIGFGSYIINSLAGFVDWLEIPAKLMPYHYYDTEALLTGDLDKGLVIYLLIVFVLGAILAALGYTRRDIG